MIKLDYLAFLTVVVTLVVFGVIDDLLGDGKAKGIRGHVKIILKGGLSTGGIKLITAVFLGMLLSYYYYSFTMQWLIYTLVFLLFINFINLMDLRPGRAIKVFLFSVVMLALTGRLNNIWIFLSIITATLFI